LNQYRGEPELEDAFEWLQNNIEQKNHRGVILNNDCWLDIDTGNTNKNYVPINKNEKEIYVNEILSKKKFPYETESMPTTSEILDLIPESYRSFEQIRQKIGWNSDTIIVLKTSDSDLIIAISCNGKGFKKISADDIKKYEQCMIISLDIRLLKWLLYGPDKAHWSDADLGSHLRYERIGSIYKRGLFYCWNHFSANV
jgi:UDP-MurNAc hydroxylase